MPKLEEVAYDSAIEKAKRLGLTALLDEVRRIVGEFVLLVEERRDANGGAALRELLDERFAAAKDWSKKQTGGVDWTKCHVMNGISVCVGVEVQVSARSDMLVMDIEHLRVAMIDGEIDIGLLVVPSDALSEFMTDRAPCLSDAKRHVRMARAEDLPILLVALTHDGGGPPLTKRTKRR